MVSSERLEGAGVAARVAERLGGLGGQLVAEEDAHLTHLLHHVCGADHPGEVVQRELPS